MTKEEARLLIAALSDELERHNYNYYILAKPTISDYEFDMKLEELARLEKEFPEFLSPSSPTQAFGKGVPRIPISLLTHPACRRRYHQGIQKRATSLSHAFVGQFIQP